MQLHEECLVGTDSSVRTEDNRKIRLRGKVVYVHSNGRFATLEFQGVHGTSRKSFFLWELTDKNRIPNRRRI